MTLNVAIQNYLNIIGLSRSQNTARTYRNALQFFLLVLQQHELEPDTLSPTEMDEEVVGWMADELKGLAPSTERLYLTALVNFFQYLAAEGLSSPNLPRIHQIIRTRARRVGQRLPQFPKDDIEKVLSYAINLAKPGKQTDQNERLRNLRDRSFLVTLADTGLRVHEACALRRGDIDWNEGKAMIIGKGNRQAVIRFSTRALTALREYLSARAQLDGGSRKQLSALPLFARHDKGAGKVIKPMTTTTGRNIVNQRVTEALGDNTSGTITPHSFRHYFVTKVLNSSGNLKLAQELARHRNISVTQRYAHLSDHELDQGYFTVFDQD